GRSRPPAPPPDRRSSSGGDSSGGPRPHCSETVAQRSLRLPPERVANAFDVGARTQHVALRDIDVTDVERTSGGFLEDCDRLEDRCLLPAADVVDGALRSTLHRAGGGSDRV